MADRLRESLKSADRAAPALSAPSLSASALLAEVGRRKVHRTRRCAAATTVCLVAATWFVWPAQRSTPDSPVASASVTVDDTANLTALAAEIAVLQAEVDALESETDPPIDSPPQLDADLRWEMEVARSAAISFYHAELVEEQDGAAAIETYRRVAERFPDTRFATLAHERIERLAPSDGNMQSL